MPKYEIDVPGQGTFEVDSPSELSDAQVYASIQSQLGSPKKEEAKEETSTLRQAADLPVNFTTGIVSGVRMLTDALGADNPISKNLRGAEEYLGDFLSAQAKNDQEEMARIQKEAEDKGVWEGIKAGAKAIAVAPANTMARVFGSAIPVVLGGSIGLLGKAYTGIKALPKIMAYGTAALMGTGIGKGAIYDAVTEELSKQNLPPEVIEKAAVTAQEYKGENLDLILTNTLAGLFAGGTGIEKILVPGIVKNISQAVAKRGVVGRAAATGFPEFIGEGFQGGTEQATQNIALQRQGFDVPTFRGVPGAVTMEGLAGLGIGAGVGALSRPQETFTPTTEDARAQAPDVPPAPLAAPVAPVAAATPAALTPEQERQLAVDQQIAQQNAFQSQFDRPVAAAETPDQAYARQMAQQDARTPVRQYTEPQPQSQFLGVGEAAIQPGQRERAQGLAAQEFGLNVGQARLPVTEEDRLARQLAAQQQMDADRFQQQTPQPVITPAQAQPRQPAPIPSARGFDRQADLLGQREGLPQVEQVGLEAQADIAGRTGQRATPQTRFVDLTPMPPRDARQKLAALQADNPDASLNIVPHPQMSGRFAIEERVASVQEAAEPRRADRPSVSYEQAVQMVRDVQRTGVITPEASAAAEQYGLNIDPALMNFAERTTPENLLVQQRRGMADEAALNAELRGGVATPEEAQRLDETGMGRPYDSIVAPREEAPAGLKGQRQRRLEDEAIAELDAEKTEFFKNLQGPELWLDGFELGVNPKSAIQTASPEFKNSFLKPEGRYSLVTTATPETKLAADKFLKEAVPILKRFGLGNVGLRIVDSINDGNADGMYSQQIISLILDSDNPMGVMRHEVIHALKELGAFTPAEWKVLTKAAKDKWINQYFNRAMQDQYQQVYLEQNGNLDGFQEYLQEEAIAQAFRFFSDPTPKGALKPFQKPSGMVANLMRRLNVLFDALRSFFSGPQNIDEMFLPNRILADIERGAITPGRAQGRNEEVPKFSLKNAPPNRYTKMTDDPTLGKTIAKVTESTLNVVRNDSSRTSSRIQFIDTSAGLTNTLKSMPLFDTNGTLRADMLHHSKAQAQNLIGTGLVAGLPYLNDDGTIAIERSENNLARALQIADRLNTNPNVIASGLSGKELIAEVARSLRGADILAEDAETRKLGERQIAEAQRMTADLAANKDTMTPKQIAKAQKAINKKRKEGSENRKMNRELQVKPEDIAWAKKQLDSIPEVQEVLDIWKAVNTSLVTLYEDAGMIDKKTADKYRSEKNYVPLFKSREDLDDSAFFRSSGTKSTPKIKALEGADITRNIWENIYKQYAMMTAAAYENQTRRISVEQMRSISPDLAVITNQSDSRVNLRYRDKGEDVNVIIENPNDLAAFQSMTYQLSPIMKFFGGFTNVLRAGALLNPMFWIRQLIRDPIQATITGQSGIVTPFHSAKEFLMISGSPEAKILAQRGVIGKIDNTQSLNEYLENVGTATQIAPNMIQKTFRKLLQIHEASDAATRVAIFKQAKSKALKDGMSEPQSVDYAVLKAREYINFAVTGNSPTLANLRQMIPFMNATIVGLDALYRAYTGIGLNPEERAKVRRTFRIRATMMVAMSVAYAMSLQDDEDYQKLPDYVKDGNMLLPIGSNEKKTFLKFSIPYEVGFLFKTLPELFVRYLSGNNTGKEVLASMRAGFIQNMPTGGTPVPQFAKPALEVMTNYSFFTNRPIEGMGDSRLPVAQRGQRASEFAKMMSGLGLDKVGLSPAKIDVLTKGYFAEFGAFFNELTDAFVATTSGVEKTPRNIENLPFMKAFLTDPQVNKAISDFYDIEKNAMEVANLFSKAKNEGNAELLQSIVADPNKLKQVGGAPVLRKISSAMSDIQKAIRIIDKNQGMAPAERRERINELQQQLGVLAERGKQIAGTIGLSR